jgi:hypothetical protein
MRDGKLYLSLNDAIALALENNLDIAIARYNLNIADTDILRARAGAAILGVPSGIVQNTPGGGVGGLGGQVGSGTGGTSLGCGWRWRRRGRSDRLYARSGIVDQQLRPNRDRNSARGPFQSTGHQHFSGRASGLQSGAKYRHGELRLSTGFPVGHKPAGWLQQHPRHDQQLLFQPESESELGFQGYDYPASSPRLWLRAQRALHPHCQEQPRAFRRSFPAAGDYHGQPDSIDVLGSGLRLRKRARAERIAGFCREDSL